ncbi:hypothetical protein LDI01_15080 [Lentilactobacillus diolivorans]|uniref:Uncharacterized protein n=2 Tax=Lentilactobacillus diolivorans TaxID=179838 RepID=A0A0R1SS09_9LACO|nr:hypothetical protein FC85_GL001595 [Lentilactobacillus diolivorans DSM 14421]GEP23915.1 hypothetical protein LDI01_15080 [Lentilactobacillus diolivorans]
MILTVGYITTKNNYVKLFYYSSLPVSKTIKVIAKYGIHSYRQALLTNETGYYRVADCISE